MPVVKSEKRPLCRGIIKVLTAFFWGGGGISDFYAGHKNILCPGKKLEHKDFLFFFW
jgi:hypothetical protein